MTAWYRALNLQRDPFASAGPLFGGGGRQRLIQQAVQQLHFGGGCVALLGEAGSGVTTLLEAADAQLSGVADRLTLSARDVPTPTALWLVLAQAMAVGETDDPVSLAEAWRRLRPTDGTALPLVLSIDSADLLTDPVLAGLVRIKQAAAGDLRLLLGGAPQLLQRLPATGIDWLCLRLQPLTRDAVADYVLTRLQASGYVGELPLDSLRLDALHQHSRGIPAQIHALVPRLLEPSVAQPKLMALRPARLPLLHVLSAAALVTAIAVSLLYRQADDGTGNPSVIDAPLDPSPSMVAPPASPASATGTGTAPADGIEPALNSDSGPLPQPVSAPLAARPDPERPTPPEPNEAAQSVDPGPGRTAEPRAASVDTASSAPVPSAGAKAVEPAGPDLSADERALSRFPPDAYVLQLFAARDPARVADYAGRAAAAGLEIYQIETRLSGAPWHVVIAGPYADRAAAGAAQGRLPVALRGAKPWPRPAAEIQVQIGARQAPNG